MSNLRTLLLGILCFLALHTRAAADPITIPVSVSTSGVFSCLFVVPCVASGNTVTISSDGGSATVTFIGVTEIFQLSNTASQVTIGRFDVVATPGYTWPAASINPDLSIFRFVLDADNPLDPDNPARVQWQFGPGGGVTLGQRGPWDLGLRPDVESPWPAANFRTNSPTLVLNESTAITAEAGLVPEPVTMLTVGSGLVGLLAHYRRRRLRASGAIPPAAL